MRAGRLELPRPCGHQDLNLARLPVPPRSRGAPVSRRSCCRRALRGMMPAWWRQTNRQRSSATSIVSLPSATAYSRSRSRCSCSRSTCRTSATTDLGQALRDLVPQLLTYALSFVVIGRYWIAHHKTFRSLRRANITLLWINLALSGFVVLLPFPTEILSRVRRHVARDDRVRRRARRGVGIVRVPAPVVRRPCRVGHAPGCATSARTTRGRPRRRRGVRAVDPDRARVARGGQVLLAPDDPAGCDQARACSPPISTTPSVTERSGAPEKPFDTLTM